MKKKAYFEYLQRDKGDRYLWRELNHLHITRAKTRNIPRNLSDVDLINNAFVHGVPPVDVDPSVLADRQGDVEHFLNLPLIAFGLSYLSLMLIQGRCCGTFRVFTVERLALTVSVSTC